jgi:hypothetical protein
MGFVEQVPGKDGVFKIYKGNSKNSWINPIRIRQLCEESKKIILMISSSPLTSDKSGDRPRRSSGEVHALENHPPNPPLSRDCVIK